LNERGRRILAALDEVSAAHKVKPAAVALAWLMARPSITAPIAERNQHRSAHGFRVRRALELSRDDVEALNAASAY